MKQIFEGECYKVLHMPISGSKLSVATFANWEEGEKKPFGADYLAKAGYSAFHVVPVENDWYQDDEILLALNSISERIEGTTVGYGVSMGGFAALNFSSYLKLDRVVACSPQYSIDRNVVNFEWRWPAEAIRLSPFQHHYIHRLRGQNGITILYDHSHELDSQHVELIKQHVTVKSIDVPGSKHNVLGHFYQKGVLSEAVTQLLSTGGIERRLLDL